MAIREWTTRLVVCGTLAVTVCGVSLAGGQAQDTPASLAALTAEVRLLRLSVEKSAQTQAQTQAMAIYLSAQQSRLLQVSARADALRKDLDAASREVTHFTEGIADAEKAVTSPLPTNIPPSEVTGIKRELEARILEARRGLARATSAESDLRSRESEATAAVQAELARWSEMIARLEQATKQ